MMLTQPHPCSSAIVHRQKTSSVSFSAERARSLTLLAIFVVTSLSHLLFRLVCSPMHLIYGVGLLAKPLSNTIIFHTFCTMPSPAIKRMYAAHTLPGARTCTRSSARMHKHMYVRTYVRTYVDVCAHNRATTSVHNPPLLQPRERGGCCSQIKSSADTYVRTYVRMFLVLGAPCHVNDVHSFVSCLRAFVVSSFCVRRYVRTYVSRKGSV